MDENHLMQTALQARLLSWSPYSHFQVGAALLAESGRIYTGCNIENAAYSPTNCAERTAFFKAVSEGERRFSAIAVAGGPAGGPPAGYAYPCGVCRQVMMEFCDPAAFTILVGTGPDDYTACTLAQLLPSGFGPASLG